jgi:hypothetical protein
MKSTKRGIKRKPNNGVLTVVRLVFFEYYIWGGLQYFFYQFPVFRSFIISLCEILTIQGFF